MSETSRNTEVLLTCPVCGDKGVLATRHGDVWMCRRCLSTIPADAWLLWKGRELAETPGAIDAFNSLGVRWWKRWAG
jgi:ribosomal protein S27AE